MDQQTLDQIEAIRKEIPEVESLLNEHQSLKQKVAELSDKGHLSSEEDQELHTMKKEKLRIKDEIEDLIHRKKSA